MLIYLKLQIDFMLAMLLYEPHLLLFSTLRINYLMWSEHRIHFDLLCIQWFTPNASRYVSSVTIESMQSLLV